MKKLLAVCALCFLSVVSAATPARAWVQCVHHSQAWCWDQYEKCLLARTVIDGACYSTYDNCSSVDSQDCYIVYSVVDPN